MKPSAVGNAANPYESENMAIGIALKTTAIAAKISFRYKAIITISFL
jgi:hypothetical protein